MTTLTARLRKLSQRWPNSPVLSRQRGAVAGLLETLYPDHAGLRRKYLLLRVFNVDSVNDLQPCQVRALMAWLSPIRDSDGRLVPCMEAAQDVWEFESAFV